jgi:5-formyltetrahydrofolate cyclo-ligase
MPLVAFDPSGNRLGMGGGFYDRTFSYLRNRKFWTKPLLIGIAYEFQRLDSLTPSPWDVPLQAIATEKSLHPTNSQEIPQ